METQPRMTLVERSSSTNTKCSSQSSAQEIRKKHITARANNPKSEHKKEHHLKHWHNKTCTIVYRKTKIFITVKSSNIFYHSTMNFQETEHNLEIKVITEHLTSLPLLALEKLSVQIKKKVTYVQITQSAHVRVGWGNKQITKLPLGPQYNNVNGTAWFLRQS